jgi:lipase chaperone LimK
MNRFVSKRLADLERLLPQQKDTWHQIIVQEDEDVDARIADLIASGEANEGDRFIIRRIVSPKHETMGEAR